MVTMQIPASRMQLHLLVPKIIADPAVMTVSYLMLLTTVQLPLHDLRWPCWGLSSLIVSLKADRLGVEVCSQGSTERQSCAMCLIGILILCAQNFH